MEEAFLVEITKLSDQIVNLKAEIDEKSAVLEKVGCNPVISIYLMLSFKAMNEIDEPPDYTDNDAVATDTDVQSALAEMSEDYSDEEDEWIEIDPKAFEAFETPASATSVPSEAPPIPQAQNPES